MPTSNANKLTEAGKVETHVQDTIERVYAANSKRLDSHDPHQRKAEEWKWDFRHIYGFTQPWNKTAPSIESDMKTHLNGKHNLIGVLYLYLCKWSRMATQAVQNDLFDFDVANDEVEKTQVINHLSGSPWHNPLGKELNSIMHDEKKRKQEQWMFPPLRTMHWKAQELDATDKQQNFSTVDDTKHQPTEFLRYCPWA